MQHLSDREFYDQFAARGVTYSMARGKPAPEQSDISMPLLDVLDSDSDPFDGSLDCRNYGGLMGIPSARAFFGEYLNVPADQVIVGGGSSLQLMFDTISRAMLFGFMDEKPWSKLDSVAFLCPVPGYDRHFAICEAMGIEMIPVPMTPDGPDMDVVEELIGTRPDIRAMWCVPKYSNPQGYTYSDETVRRLVALEPVAPDFRLLWDNAYAEHHLFDDPADQDQLLDIRVAAEEAGKPDIYLQFASTSKITFAGSGISCIAASEANINDAVHVMSFQTIAYDKMNQLRHVRFFGDVEGLRAHMRQHAAILRPKFELVERVFSRELSDVPGVSWTKPRGGYFVSFQAPTGCALRIVELARDAGVTLTGAGAPFPHGHDPDDSNIRIAPTYPSLEELEEALQLFCVCVRLAAAERDVHEG